MIHTYEWKAMGCGMLVAVEIAGPRPAILEQVPFWVEEWEQTLSRFRPDSELSQLNRSGGMPFHASPVLWSVYQAALEAERFSVGLVTPTLLNELEQAGYVQSFTPPFPPLIPAGASKIHRNPPVLHPPHVEELNLAAKRIISLPGGVRIDFGGIAKGWAARQAVRRLKSTGPALVDAGGDIAFSGPRLQRLPWTIGLENPFAPDTDLTSLNIRQGGVATSGRDYRRWRQNGKWMHHIIDPRTGQPADTDVLTATVIAPDVLQAETAAKAAFILGSREGIAWLQRRPSLAGMLVREDGGYIFTRNFAGYLVEEPEKWSQVTS